MSASARGVAEPDFRGTQAAPAGNCATVGCHEVNTMREVRRKARLGPEVQGGDLRASRHQRCMRGETLSVGSVTPTMPSSCRNALQRVRRSLCGAKPGEQGVDQRRERGLGNSFATGQEFPWICEICEICEIVQQIAGSEYIRLDPGQRVGARDATSAPSV